MMTINTEGHYAELQLDAQLRPVSGVSDVLDLFQFKSGCRINSIRDLISLWIAEGWIDPEETICGYDGVAFRTNTLMNTSVGQHLLFNTKGDLVRSRHIKSGKQNHTRLVFHRTNNRIRAEHFLDDDPERLAAEAFLAAILDDDDLENRLVHPVTRSDASGVASYLMLESGGIVASLGSVRAYDAGFRPQRFEDLKFDLNELKQRLHASHRAFLARRTSSDTLSALDATKLQLSDQTTNIIVLRLLNLSELLTVEKVRAMHPHMTRREAQVVASLALGNTIKGAATKFDKSPGTLSIQARSAVLKSKRGTLQALLPELLLQSIP